MAVAEFQATLIQEAQGLPPGRWEGVADEDGERKYVVTALAAAETRGGGAPLWRAARG